MTISPRTLRTIGALCHLWRVHWSMARSVSAEAAFVVGAAGDSALGGGDLR